MSGSLHWGFAMITVGDERHRTDRRRKELTALFKREDGSRRDERGGNISHADRLLEARRETPGSHASDFVALAVEYSRAFAHRLATVEGEPNALERRPGNFAGTRAYDPPAP